MSLKKRKLPKEFSIKSGRQDSNLRPPGPKPGAMTGLRYAPSNFLTKPAESAESQIYNFTKDSDTDQKIFSTIKQKKD